MLSDLLFILTGGDWSQVITGPVFSLYEVGALLTAPGPEPDPPVWKIYNARDRTKGKVSTEGEHCHCSSDTSYFPTVKFVLDSCKDIEGNGKYYEEGGDAKH